MNGEICQSPYSIYLLALGSVLFQYVMHIAGNKPAINFVVYNHNGSQTAASQAAGCLYGEFPIGSGVAGGNPKVLFHSL